MPKLLKDPFTHFILLGGLLFAGLAWRGDSDSGGRDLIRIDAERVEQLSSAAALLQGRAPARAELEALIEPVIREEIMYREALALGLDDNDDEVRRRLVEKMEYLTQDLADPEAASESELREFFAANPERFRIPASVDFEQIYFSPRQRGERLHGDIASALASLQADGDAAGLGDRTPLSAEFTEAPREQVEVLFGAAMTEALFTMDAGVWAGPFESDFGLHLARLHRRSPARMPSFDEARQQVAEGFAADRRQRANDAVYAEMRARYRILIDWPESAPAPATP